jgi:hypothetical protein
MNIDLTTPTKDMLEMAEHDGRRFERIKPEFMNTYIGVHFATGTKVHVGMTSSSVALCGGWMKYNGLRYRQYTQPDCKRCLKALERKEATQA